MAEIQIFNTDTFKFDFNSIPEIDLTLTDPPYNKDITKVNNHENGQWDSISMDDWKNFTEKLYYKTREGGHFVFFGDNVLIYDFIYHLYGDWELITVGRWEKRNAFSFKQGALGIVYERLKLGKVEKVGKQTESQSRWHTDVKDGLRAKITLPESIAWNKYVRHPLATWESIAFCRKPTTSPLYKVAFESGRGIYQRNVGGFSIPVFEEPFESSPEEHLTPKPIPLMVKLFDYLIPVDPALPKFSFNVFDPFMGRGSTLIAGILFEHTNKLSMGLYGIELRKETFELAERKIREAEQSVTNPLQGFLLK